MTDPDRSVDELGAEARAELARLELRSDQFEAAADAPGWLRPLLAYQRAMDTVAQFVGSVAKYLVIAVVLIGFVNAVLRYVGRFSGQQLTSNRYIELQWYLYAAVFLLGFAYILRNGVNVRVDFWYAERSSRTKAWVDLVGHLVALIPFCVLALTVTWGPILTSWGARPDGSFRTARVWEIWERSPDPGGLPRAPVKSILWIGFALLLLQALAELVKLIAELTGNARHSRVVDEAGPPGRVQ